MLSKVIATTTILALSLLGATLLLLASMILTPYVVVLMSKLEVGERKTLVVFGRKAIAGEPARN